MGINNHDYNLRFCEEELIPVIRKTAEKYLTVPFLIEKKGHGNYVTSIDKAVEQDLKTELHQLVPEAGFIAEESGEDANSELNWVIDPIDGTTNFIYGLQYAVSVALMARDIKQVILGVVYNPKADILYYACRGQGSFLIENGIKKQLKVGIFPTNEGIAVFGMPYNREKAGKILDVAKSVYKFTSDLKRIGPSSLDICMVAEGKAKLYFELDLNIWDICAGMLILTEAGGDCKQDDDLFLFGTDAVLDLVSSYGSKL